MINIFNATLSRRSSRAKEARYSLPATATPPPDLNT